MKSRKINEKKYFQVLPIKFRIWKKFIMSKLKFVQLARKYWSILENVQLYVQVIIIIIFIKTLIPSKLPGRNICHNNKCVKFHFQNILRWERDFNLKIFKKKKNLYFCRFIFQFNCNCHANNNTAMKSSKSQYIENMKFLVTL